MVRKIVISLVICILLVGAICTQASADTHSIYDEGTISSTYLTYFKDIVSGIKFTDNYVAFRSGQYSYTMVVGDLEYNNGVISLNSEGKEYVFASRSISGYNQQYGYEVNNINNFSITCGDNIIYSDVGDYPQLIERGDRYEILTLFLLCIVVLCIVINRIFFKR